MKKIIAIAAVASLAASTAFAGSLVEPEMEPMVEVMEEDASSSGGLLLPLLALVALGLLISSSDNESSSET
jgi:hypothetical protein